MNRKIQVIIKAIVILLIGVGFARSKSNIVESFDGLGLELPMLTILFIKIPNFVHIACFAAIALIFICCELTIRSNKIKNIAVVLTSIFFLGYMALFVWAMYLPVMI